MTQGPCGNFFTAGAIHPDPELGRYVHPLGTTISGTPSAHVCPLCTTPLREYISDVGMQGRVSKQVRGVAVVEHVPSTHLVLGCIECAVGFTLLRKAPEDFQDAG